MSAFTHAAIAALACLSGFVFLYVGYVTSRRPGAGADREALHAFGWWWYGLAGLNFYAAVVNPFVAANLVDLDLYVTFLLAVLFVLCVALWGLSYYLIYLFSGDRRWRTPLAILFAGYAVWITYLVIAANPNGYTVTRWGARIDYEYEWGGSVGRILGLLLFGPIIIGALGYLSIYFRVEGRQPRYRIAIVALTMLLWFGSSIVASWSGFNRWEWWPLVNRFISLSGAVMVLAAYKPPPFIRRWLEAEGSYRPEEQPLAGGVHR